jgi:hypothetical protein
MENNGQITAPPTSNQLYSTNVRMSQTLMGQMINLMNIQDARLFTLVTEQNNTPRQTPPPPSNILNPMEQYIQELFSNSGIELDFRIPDGENSISRPSAEEISMATSQLRYSEIENNNLYERCPISHEPFTPDTIVTRINHCGHYFNSFSLNRWLEMNVRCPICRHDIRTVSSRPDLSRPEEPTTPASVDTSRSESETSDPDTP